MKTVQEYLETKGLKNETLDAAKALRMEGGQFVNFDVCKPWCLERYSYLRMKRTNIMTPPPILDLETNKLVKCKGFQEAIFIPVFDLEEECVGVTIRVLGEDVPKSVKHGSKFIEPKKKKTTLYNLNEALPYIVKIDRVFVVEGNIDCLAMKQAGLLNTVSIMGTSLSDKHMFLLTSLTKNVILCLDMDGRKENGELGAGEKAIKKIINLYKDKANLFKIELPIGVDPDVFLKEQGVGKLLKKIERIEK